MDDKQTKITKAQIFLKDIIICEYDEQTGASLFQSADIEECRENIKEEIIKNIEVVFMLQEINK